MPEETHSYLLYNTCTEGGLLSNFGPVWSALLNGALAVACERMGITVFSFHPSRFIPAESWCLTVTSSPVYPSGSWNNVRSTKPNLNPLMSKYIMIFLMLFNLLLLINVNLLLSLIKSINFFDKLTRSKTREFKWSKFRLWLRILQQSKPYSWNWSTT